MRRLRRLMVVTTAVAAVGVPVGSLLLVPPSAGAAGAAGAQLSCTSLKGTYAGGLTIKKCTPTGHDVRSATVTLAALSSGEATLTWKKGGDTTTVAVRTSLSATSPACAQARRGVPKYQEIDVTGTVTGGTSQGTAAGDPVSLTLCETLKTAKLVLAPGTAADF